MKQKHKINLKIPIFSWLFFLFLSSEISSYYNNLQFGKPVQIERVDQFIFNSGKKEGFAKFTIRSEKSGFFQKLNFQFLRLNLLSAKLNNRVHIVLNKQFSLTKLVLRNIILHFRSPNLTSDSSVDFPDFIS